jgi:transposase
MENQLSVITERIDDVVLLLHVMMQMKLPELLNKHLPRHWKQEGLDWGWVIVIWLAYILSEGDHRKVVVREWVKQQSTMIAQVCGLTLRETDFTDDRLGLVLSKLSETSVWQEIETELNRQTIRIYRLPSQRVRLDATTVSGNHLVSEDGLFQFGHSKDDPSLPHLKAMLASLDPLGMPLATHIVSGERADDGLYLPIFEQVRQSFDAEGLLWVGDCKMGALATRAQIHHHQHYYLTSLARVGKVPELLVEGLSDALASQSPRLRVNRLNKKGQLQEIASGYELSRQQESKQADGTTLKWTERVLLVHSPAHAQQQQRGLDHRLQTATAKLTALTPKVGRGKRQIRDLSELQQKAKAILKTHQVEGLLEYSYEFQAATKQRKARYQITGVSLQQDEIEQAQQTFGWRVYVTNAPLEQLSFEQAVLSVRDAWIQERGFSRLKGKSLGAAPLFVQRDDQAQGLMHLLSLGLRILTLIEFGVQQNLKEEKKELLGLFPGNPKRATARPTAERILKAFKPLSLTILKVNDQEYGHVTPLNPLQQRLLKLLDLSPDIYSSLESSPA